MNVLFLYESPLPRTFHHKTLFLGEVRVIAAQPQVKHIGILGPGGDCFYDVEENHPKQTPLEQKVSLHPISGFSHPRWFYVWGIILFFHAVTYIRKNHVDVIHAESPHISGWAAVLLGKIFHIPTCIEYRASYFALFEYRFKALPILLKRWLFDSICRLVFHNCSFVLANSKAYANYLMRYYQLTNVHYYNAGARPPKIKPSKNHTKTFVGYIGRMYADKGPDYLIKAIAFNKAKFQKQQIYFLLAGKGPLLPKLKTMVKNYDLESLVTFLNVQDRWEFLSRIHLLVNPNIIFNALEMVNYEAAALKIPIICFGNETYPETVIHGQTGIKVANKDFKALSEAIYELAKNPGKRAALGEAGYRHFDANYTFNKQVMNLQKAYALL